MTMQHTTHHGLRSLAESRVGCWAVVLGGITLTNVVLILTSLALNIVDLPDSFSENWAFGAWGVSVWVTGSTAVVTGLVAMTRRHERSWMVLVATLLGFLPVVLLISEAALGEV
jgi:hypothetical protein